jgi:Carboxypeptidase regulatory-like domain
MRMKLKTPFSKRFLSPAIFLLVISSVLFAQSGRGWMKGIVLGVSDSRGMSGAVVELSGDPDNPRLRSVGFDAKADETGRYFFKNIPYGGYTFKVSAPGFIPYEIKVYIPSDAETQLHVRLRKEKL